MEFQQKDFILLIMLAKNDYLLTQFFYNKLMLPKVY
jgi:hypothetical protein